VTGIFRVKIGSDYVYLTANGQYAFAGSLVDLSTGENLTEARRNRDRLEVLSGFPADDFLLFPAEGEERARVLVFTDTTCPYCRKLHQEVPALRKAGVTIAYIPFPRGGKGSTGEQALRSVWCAGDRPTAFAIAVGQADGTLGTADCPAAAVVDAGYRLGLQVGVSGAPTIVLPTGAALPGYLNVQGLLAHLGLGKVSTAR
jgi:thiol:disulfide interchange protein DsbC